VKPSPPAKWEYAELSSYSNKKTWSTPGTIVSAGSWGELKKKLGAKEDAHFAALLTRLGNDGWELVTHATITVATGTGNATINEFWTFKRPVR
jgi:hypothetical protein